METFFNYTAEEIIAAWEHNETFCGHHANMEKVQLYFQLKKDLETLMDNCKDILAVNGFGPNPREKHAIIWADLLTVAVLSKEDTDALSAIVHKADGIVFAALEDSLRITFDIKGIWGD